MSITLISQVFDQQIEPGGKKLVLLAFADAANDEGWTWMALVSQRGKTDIKKKTSMSIRAIRGHVASLEREGRLKRGKNFGRGYMWHVSATAAVSADLKATSPAKTERSPADFAAKPYFNRQEKIKTRGRSKSAVDRCPIVGRDLLNGVSLPQWNAWLEMRVSLGKKVEPYVADLVLRRLADIAKAGWHPGDVLDRSTVNAWSDVYMPEAGRVTGVRRILAGHSIEPVGMSEADKAELIRIAAIESMPEKLAARRKFIASIEQRNETGADNSETSGGNDGHA